MRERERETRGQEETSGGGGPGGQDTAGQGRELGKRRHAGQRTGRRGEEGEPRSPSAPVGALPQMDFLTPA